MHAIVRGGLVSAAGVGFGGGGPGGIRAGHHRPDRQIEGHCEVEVALVVGRHGHNRAGAVVGQHVVAGVHRDLLAVHRIDCVTMQKDTGLGPIRCQPIDLGDRPQRLHIGREFGFRRGAGSKFGSQVAVGCHHKKRCPIQRVRTGGKDRDRLVASHDRKLHLGPLGATDPVALHRQHLVRPLAFELFHVGQQPVGIVGDPEVPLGEFALGHRRVAALAESADYLLIGQHRLTVGTPVDVGGFAVRQPTVVHLQEKPLVPVVILRVAGVQGAVPVEGAGISAHRSPLGGDVFIRPGRRVDSALDRGILRWEAERVPADGVQHVEPPLHPVPRQHIAQCIGLGVPHVQIPGGVGEHVQHVLARPWVSRVA